jgi:hypothetical protein
MEDYAVFYELNSKEEPLPVIIKAKSMEGASVSFFRSPQVHKLTEDGDLFEIIEIKKVPKDLLQTVMKAIRDSLK